MAQLTPHFSLEELTRTNTGLPNEPNEHEKGALKYVAQQLEKIRTVLGGPLHVTSGYRGPEVNKAVRGVSTSAHCDGLAADFDPPAGMSHYDAAKKIEGMPHFFFDQLILEYGWIHISFDVRMRRQVLTKKSAKAPYLKGLHK